jgi:GNAT superfamily N-acetyltransferase
MAMLEVRVVPESRRQGIGTAVMDFILPQLRASGRKVVAAFDVRVGGAGELWAGATGFTRTHEMVLQTLEVNSADPALWRVPAPAGFGAIRWVDAAPDDVVESFAAARTAIRDAPRGDASYEEPAWTAQRVREHEATFRERGVEQRVVAAVHEATGTIAGLTEIETRPEDSAMALQQDTAVLAEFRGHGLGRYVKAEMMRWLLADRPSIERVITQTASSNVHMIRVNHQLGYTTTATMATIEADVDVLLSRS